MNKRIIAIALSTLLVGLTIGLGFAGIAPDKVQAAFTAVFPKPEPCAVGEIWNGSQCTSVQTLYDKCREKSADQQEFCLTVVASRLKESGAFLTTKRFVKPTPEVARTFKISLPKAVAVPTAAKRFTQAEKATIEAHVYQEILAGIPKLKIKEPLPKYICRVSDLGWTRCLGTDSIVGFFDNVQAAKAIKDIETMVGRLTQEEKYKGILISCPVGRYGTANEEELLGMSEGGGINPPTPPGGEGGHLELPGAVELPPTMEQLLGGTGDNAFTKFCSNLVGGSGSDGGTGTDHPSGGVGGFGGIGSFDGAFCGFQFQVGSMDVWNEALKMSNEAHKHCQTTPNAEVVNDIFDDIVTIIEAIIEGGPPFPGMGTGTEEEPKPAEPATDAELALAELQVRTNLENEIQKNRTPSDVKGNFSKDGSNYITDITWSNGEKTRVTETEKVNLVQEIDPKTGDALPGDPWGVIGKYDKDGKFLGEVQVDPHTRQVVPPLEPIGGKKIYQDCLDEQCNTCRDFAQFFPTSLEGCQFSGSNSLACQRFEEMQGCCGDSGRFPGDPRIMLPNPEGDLFCMGTPDLSLREEFCTQECSRATPVDGADCRAACLARPTVSEMMEKFKLTLWEQVCPYAYSENCFQSAGLPLPNTPRPEKPPNVPDPRNPFEIGVLSPLDRSLDAPSHTLLPTTVFDRHAPAVTSDMFPDIGIQPPDGVGHQPPDGVPDTGGNKPF